MLVMLFGMAVVQVATLRFILGHSAGSQPVLMVQIVVMAVIFGVITSDMAGLRALRTLPLSTYRLAGLILSVPAVAGLAAGLIAILFNPEGDAGVLPIIRLLSTALLVAGVTSLILAIVMHITGGVRMLVMMVLGILASMLVPLGTPHPWMLAATGALTGIGGFALLLRGLRRSSKFYQPRPFFGAAFGQAPGAM